MNHEICEAREENLEEVFELWKQLMVVHKELDPVFFGDISEIMGEFYLEQFIFSTNEIMFICIKEAKIVGFVTASLSKNYSLYNSIRYGSIEDVMVDKHFQKQGIGKSLIKHAIEWAKEKGVQRVELGVVHSNNKVYNFYENLGF